MAKNGEWLVWKKVHISARAWAFLTVKVAEVLPLQRISIELSLGLKRRSSAKAGARAGHGTLQKRRFLSAAM